jgi:methanogenic corrinoid protein MtbC1
MAFSKIDEFENALITANRLQVREIVSQYSREHTPFELVEELLSPAMELVGQGWEDGRLALSQVYMSGQICAEIAKRVLKLALSHRKHTHPIAHMGRFF